jgi:hypothetical protein
VSKFWQLRGNLRLGILTTSCLEFFSKCNLLYLKIIKVFTDPKTKISGTELKIQLFFVSRVSCICLKYITVNTVQLTNC